MLAIDLFCLLHNIRALEETPDGVAKLWQSILTRDPHIVLLVDSKPYWRTLLYPEYKAGRTSAPLESELIESGTTLGLPTLCKEGLEADDWAGLLCHYKTINKVPGVLRLLTVDTDWLQLVSDEDGIEWENFGRHTPGLRRNQEVIEWAFRIHKVWIPHPSYVGNLKRVMGDKSDNIPPNHPEPLTELKGPEWLGALDRCGYSISELLQNVAEVYEVLDGRGKNSGGVYHPESTANSNTN